MMVDVFLVVWWPWWLMGKITFLGNIFSNNFQGNQLSEKREKVVIVKYSRDFLHLWQRSTNISNIIHVHPDQGLVLVQTNHRTWQCLRWNRNERSFSLTPVCLWWNNHLKLTIRRTWPLLNRVSTNDSLVYINVQWWRSRYSLILFCRWQLSIPLLSNFFSKTISWIGHQASL